MTYVDTKKHDEPITYRDVIKALLADPHFADELMRNCPFKYLRGFKQGEGTKTKQLLNQYQIIWTTWRSVSDIEAGVGVLNSKTGLRLLVRLCLRMPQHVVLVPQTPHSTFTPRSVATEVFLAAL